MKKLKIERFQQLLVPEEVWKTKTVFHTSSGTAFSTANYFGDCSPWRIRSLLGEMHSPPDGATWNAFF